MTCSLGRIRRSKTQQIKAPISPLPTALMSGDVCGLLRRHVTTLLSRAGDPQNRHTGGSFACDLKITVSRIGTCSGSSPGIGRNSVEPRHPGQTPSGLGRTFLSQIGQYWSMDI